MFYHCISLNDKEFYNKNTTKRYHKKKRKKKPKENYFLTACLGPLISRLDAKLAKVESKSPLSILDPVCFSDAAGLGP